MRSTLLVSLLVLSFAPACGGGTDASGPGDGGADPGLDEDLDGDGFTPRTGDCDDHDDDTYPGAVEQADGVDNDCDGVIDDDLPEVDDDGDGYSNVEGDCDDTEPLVNPGSVEVDVTIDDDGDVVPEGVDNDCDGQIDEGNAPCDATLTGQSAEDFGRAVELCGDWLQGAEFSVGVPATQRAIKRHFGSVYTPHAGAVMAVLSTGLARDAGDPGWVNPSDGTATGGPSHAHPLPQGDPGDGCGAADPATVNDYVSLTFTIEVPSNAQAVAYDFNFMSAEFPRWVCSDYDDTFLAILDSSQFHGNISFDDAGRPVTINVGFFDVCQPGAGPACTGAAELAGTGFQSYGGTGWLHTIAPVPPGETITLTFHLFDEGDSIWDSLVLIDNFQWLGVPVDGPITVDREVAADVEADLARGLSTAELRARY
ncbi:MAG: putative metal-binding motif-containing protein [Kofleriaceae bacterium]|nr:putative metal-binding motif-containing protein [Myxococcales bacterium]MCB9565512.1 putative metal-binding motif-containing protein [Kofleriaceae bacterium]